MSTAILTNTRTEIERLEEQWDSLSISVGKSMRLSESEIQKLMKHRTAKLIGLAPFIVECNDADRYAMANLSLYILDQTEYVDCFDHKKSDNRDIERRIILISRFENGNPDLIQEYKDLLVIQMVGGYKKSALIDMETETLNPVGDGTWSADLIINTRKTRIIERGQNHLFASIMPVASAELYAWDWDL